MPRPPLTDQQTEAALNAYISAREQAWRYVLGAVDPTAYDAPARPFLDVLRRVQELVVIEIGRYTEETTAAETPDAPPPTPGEEVHHHV